MSETTKFPPGATGSASRRQSSPGPTECQREAEIDRDLGELLGGAEDVARLPADEPPRHARQHRRGAMRHRKADQQTGDRQLRREPDPDCTRSTNADVLQPGYKQVAAGYVVYGSSTMLVYTTGHGVFGFTLDPSIGAYLLSHERVMMPEYGTQYSVNEANAEGFPIAYRKFLMQARSGALGRTYSSRYIGSLVADFHRVLLKGGIFLYPPTTSHPKGKLRLLYEANPVAFLAEQAGGIASSGTERILEIEPTSLHQRTPLIVGSKTEVEHMLRLIKEESR